MSTYSWINSSSSNTLSWSNAANWSSGTIVPGSADTALINSSGNYSINFDGSGSLFALSMTAPGATLGFVTNSVTLLNSLSLTAGNLNISGGGIVAAKSGTSSLLINGGTLAESGGNFVFGTGGGTISSGLVTLTGGQFTAGGTLIVSGGTFTESGAAASLGNVQFNGGTIALNSGTMLATGTILVGASESITLGGARINPTGGFVNSGTVGGIGTIVTAVSGSGSVIANSGSGGTLTLGGTVSGQSFTINNKSVLQFGSAVAAGETITFNGPSAAVLSITDGANDFAGTISNFVGGDSIVVSGAVSYVSNGTTMQAWSGTGGTGSVLATITSTSDLGTRTENTSAFTVCFAAGSRIRTEQGDVAVEELAEGQRVAVLRDGAVAFTPITWIGERRINLSAHPQPQTAAPVRIRRGAVGENLPERDLLLSPDHCLFLDGKLVPAKSLINGMTIVQERALPAVHYFHVEVDPHAVLLAEGLPVESYLDTGNRAYFENCGAALVLHPEFTINAGLKAWETHACAPLTVQPEAVQPIWQRLAERAEAMGFSAPQLETTQDPDLHLVADGRTIRPMAARDGRYVFALPAGCDSVRLVSRASIPSDLAAWLDDWRPLGVAVTGLTARTPDGQQLIPADHPGLVRGWHAVETDGATTWRWTAGNAELALDLGDGPVIVEVQVCNTARYIVEPVQQERQSLAA